jgi:Ca2+-binding EF-hand superfamily protein
MEGSTYRRKYTFVVIDLKRTKYFCILVAVMSSSPQRQGTRPSSTNEKSRKSEKSLRHSTSNKEESNNQRRGKSSDASNVPPPIIKTKSDKSLNTKGDNASSKKRKSKSRSHDMNKKKEEKKKHSVRTRKSCYEKFMLNFGFYVGNVTLKDPRALEAASALDLKQWHLRRLKAKFDQIDIDGSGNIDFDEFFEAIGELRSPFTDKLFALIDLDGSGTIEYDEFVRVLATYCMFTKDEILRFCFECFDVDRSGTIDEKEFVELCKYVTLDFYFLVRYLILFVFVSSFSIPRFW